jgi:DNA polymerase-3 subunit epsilon
MPNKETDKSDSVSWAKRALSDPNSVILDLETTGLGEYPEVKIVQISIVSMSGKCLLSALINPESVIPLPTSKIHGIYNSDVDKLPTFSDYSGIVSSLLRGRNVVAYNTKFDISLLVSTYKGLGIPLPYFTEECCMDYYSQFVGDYNEKKGDYKWKKLPCLAYGKAHDSLNDCLSTLEVIKIMAGAPTLSRSDDFDLDF